MSIVRFEPFRDLALFQDRVNRLFGDLYGQRDEGVLSNWVPAVDIYEDDKGGLVLKAELPDVKREDVSVTVENNTLTLSGERKLESEVKKEKFHRIERAYGRFSRSFSLPATVDANRIAAEFKDGVLSIRLPFREEVKPRTIDVAVA
jgi:HSP20 family protein